MKKKRLTIEECKRQYSEAFEDATGRPDKRLKGPGGERIIRAMVHMINEGETPWDAKIKAMCVALPPDHFEAVPPLGAFPKLMYHESGSMKSVEDEAEYDELVKQKGWAAKPSQKHLDKLQAGTTPRDENIRRLKRELDAELKAKEAEQTAAA